MEENDDIENDAEKSDILDEGKENELSLLDKKIKDENIDENK